MNRHGARRVPATARRARREQRLQRRYRRERAFKGLCLASVLLASAFLLLMLGSLLHHGAAALTRLPLDGIAAVERTSNTAFFTNGDSREPQFAGIRAALAGSVLMLLITLAAAFPVGLAAAVYLEEFAPRRAWTRFLEFSVNNLAAMPSLVFGLLGLVMLIDWFGLPRSVPLVGGLVLALLTLPVIVISSRSAIRAVPDSIREASLGLGASRVQMVSQHVLPQAMPGIVSGTIIGLSRSLGETAPLLLLGMAAFTANPPQGVMDPASALPVQIYRWATSPEAAFAERASAAILVLLALLLLINLLAAMIRRRVEK